MEAPLRRLLQTILMKAKVVTKATKNVTTRMMVNIYIWNTSQTMCYYIADPSETAMENENMSEGTKIFISIKL